MSDRERVSKGKTLRALKADSRVESVDTIILKNSFVLYEAILRSPYIHGDTQEQRILAASVPELWREMAKVIVAPSS